MRWALGVTRKDKIKTSTLCEREGKNRKAGRLTSGHKVTLVWKHQERRRLHWKKNNRDGNTWQKERKANEEMDGFGERRHGDDWNKGGRRS